MRPAEGALLGGRYRFREHLGSGGMASVWLATDERLGRDVAIKLMAEHLADDPRWLKRFGREAKAAAGLAHPHIVSVFDFGVEEHRPYLVMAYLPGGTLKERLASGRPPPPAMQVARELLGALAHVHAAGILHRDVKPANLLLDAEGRTHLTDFGIARGQDSTTLTQTGLVLGTMRYLAPEVAHGEPATELSDLYGAGAVLCEVAEDDAPPALASLVDRLTAENPALRPPSARDALAALEDAPTAPTRVLSAPSEEPTAPTTPLRRSDVPSLEELRRSPWFVPGAGLAAILVLAALVVALAGGGDDTSGSGEPPPASAPLEEQLRELDQAIDRAR
jgi:eukaryotic-like serine/threonine-protein kinase